MSRGVLKRIAASSSLMFLLGFEETDLCLVVVLLSIYLDSSFESLSYKKKEAHTPPYPRIWFLAALPDLI